MKKRITLVGALAVIVVGVGAAVSSSSPTATTAHTAAAVRAGGSVKLSATLTAKQEKPAPKGAPKGATGKFTATLKGSTLTWTLSWSHLSGAATAAHIHQGAVGVAGPVVIALCGPCKSPMSGSSLLGKSVIASIEKGGTYVNVHTKKNANGEIRGQLKIVK